MRRDSVKNTLIVATVLCVVCSVLVSGAAVGLRSIQEANKTLDRNKNVLLVAGLIDSKDVTAQVVDELFEERIKKVLVDLDNGQSVGPSASPVDMETYDPRVAAKDPEMSEAIPADQDFAGIKRRERYSFVYEVTNENGELAQVVIPIYGKGLWSTLYGFIALKADLDTVSGITYYEHGETPGLGGEVENPQWQAQWVDKSVYDDQGDVELSVVKGTVDQSAPDAKFHVDGLSGATITSNGVTNMIEYWLGPHGFGPFLDRLRDEKSAIASSTASAAVTPAVASSQTGGEI